MGDRFLIYEELPEEPEMAFLYLEEVFHRELNALKDEWRGDDGPPDSYYIEYISKVLAAKTELGLDILNDWVRPDLGHYREDSYLNFRHDVVHYRTSIQIRNSRRNRAFSVRLDGKAKSTIHHYVDQIRQRIASSDLSDRKKERLFDKLSAFENEVDRDRTRFESFGAAMVELGGFVGEAMDAVDFYRLTNAIAKVLWGAKTEEKSSLPAPDERKRIEPPRKSAPDGVDDDIPF